MSGLRAFLSIAIVMLLSSLLNATNFSFTGTFTHDTDLQTFTFTLLNPTPGVTLRTWSYAGGTDAAGQVIPSGGFEPYLNLYLSDGTQMNPGFSGPCGGPYPLSADPSTGECADVYYPTERSFPGGVWSPGTYILVLSTEPNQGIGNLSDGFFGPNVLGVPVPSNFSCQNQGTPPSVPLDAPFCDTVSTGTLRTGNWELDIVGVDSATQATTGVPEPGSLLLLAAGLTGFASTFRRKLVR